MTRAMATSRRGLLGAGLALPLAAGLPFRAFADEAYAEVGPFETASIDKILTDPMCGRQIATRAYYPAKPGRYPTIIFSHGFGGSLVTFGNTGKIWASHGYVVLHPTHSDSLASPDPAVPADEAAVMRRYRGQRGAVDPATRQAFVKVLDNPFFIASRLRDVGALMAALKDPPEAVAAGLDPTMLARTDTGKIGMCGHSFGAYTTLVVAGAKLSPPSAAPIPTGFSGFMSMSGQGPGRMGLHDDSFGGVTKPMMATTGTRDFGAAGETPPWRLKPYDLAAPGRKYAVVVDGFRHMDFDPAVSDPEFGVRGAALRKLQLEFWAGVLGDDRKAFEALAAQAKASVQTDPVWLRSR